MLLSTGNVINNKVFKIFFIQRRLGDAAKKAMSKLQLRTIKRGDKVTEVRSRAHYTHQHKVLLTIQ